MTLRELITTIDYFVFDKTNCELNLSNLDSFKELKSRIEFIEQLIEDDLDLDDNFVLSYIWKGE